MTVRRYAVKLRKLISDVANWKQDKGQSETREIRSREWWPKGVAREGRWPTPRRSHSGNRERVAQSVT